MVGIFWREFHLFDKRASVKTRVDDIIVTPHVIANGCRDRVAAVSGGKKSRFGVRFVVGGVCGSNMWKGVVNVCCVLVKSGLVM